MTNFRLGESSKAHRIGVDKRLIEISDLAIKLTLVDFGHGPVAGLRLADVQNDLFKNGLSQADGYRVIGKHMTGKALDFYGYVDGRATWEPTHLAMVGAAFLQAACILGYKVEWGGLWDGKSVRKRGGVTYGWDMPHIELID